MTAGTFVERKNEVEEEITDLEIPDEAVPSNAPARIVGGIPYFEQYMMLAERISRTAMVPQTLRGKPDEVLAVVMYGAELGIGPMQALQQINFIAGKPSASAELLRALVLEAGHQFIVTADKEKATAQCKRKDWGEWQTTTFTLEDALTAGLIHGTNSGWSKYPDQMMAARVTSKACRMWFADVISGMSYTPEEVLAFTTHPGSEPATDGEPTAKPEELARLKGLFESLNSEGRTNAGMEFSSRALPSRMSTWTSEQVATGIEIIERLGGVETVDGELVEEDEEPF